MARSMKDFMSGKGSVMGGATRKMEVMGLGRCVVKMEEWVEGSSQSNLIAWALGREGVVPEREAMRMVLPFAERRGAMRAAIFPVPPVRRIVLLEVDMMSWSWWLL